MARRRLPDQIADALTDRIRAGEWGANSQLPTEQHLGEEYGVSRVTLRQALKILEGRGLIVAKQGKGTFVSHADGLVTAGLQELKSITQSIREMGKVPSMEYLQRDVREATAQEAERLDVEPGAGVVALRRVISADGEVVAFVEDVMPLWVFGSDFVPARLTGSVFGYLEQHTHVRPRKAIAQIHARAELPDAWADVAHRAREAGPFLLLDEHQFDTEDRPFMHTRAYFVDGKYTFAVVRMT